MTLSPDTLHVIAFLEQQSGHGLRKKNDLAVLLEIAAEREAAEELNALTFHGRQLFGIYNTLRRAAPGSEGYPALEREFTSAAESIRETMARLLVDADEETVTRFNEVYYAMSQGGLRNLVDLAHDLAVLKGVQNDRKHAPPGEPEG